MTLPGRWSPVDVAASSGVSRSRPFARSSARYVEWWTTRYVAAQLPVLVAERVEAVRAGRHDRPLPHPVAVERLDVARREHLEDVVVAHPARRVARARLLLARGRRTGRRPRAGTSRPPARPSGCAGRRPRRNRPSRGPRARRGVRRRATSATVSTSNGSGFVQSRRADAGWPHGLPWSSMARNAPVSSCGKRESSRTRLRRSPTILSTCSMRTGHASTQAPQVTQSQTASYGIASSTIGFASAVGVGRRVVEAVRLAHDRRVRDDVDPVLGLDRHVPDAHDEVLRVERLAGVPGRAGLLAAAALGAGEAVEQVLPAEVLERAQAERRVLGLEVELRQLAARRELAEPDVREGSWRCGGAC